MLVGNLDAMSIKSKDIPQHGATILQLFLHLKQFDMVMKVKLDKDDENLAMIMNQKR